MGVQLIVLQINGTSSLSISLITIIPFLAKKCSLNSLVASLKIDFYTKTTLAPDFTILFISPAIYFLSSFIILSMAE